MQVSVNHQLEVHKAPAFLPVVLDVGSPQSALDVDKDTSCRIRYSSVTEKKYSQLKKQTMLNGSLVVQDMARPQVQDGGDRSKIWRVVTNFPLHV
jgi:hypothetical protein